MVCPNRWFLRQSNAHQATQTTQPRRPPSRKNTKRKGFNQTKKKKEKIVPFFQHLLLGWLHVCASFENSLHLHLFYFFIILSGFFSPHLRFSFDKNGVWQKNFFKANRFRWFAVKADDEKKLTNKQELERQKRRKNPQPCEVTPRLVTCTTSPTGV